MRYYQSLALLFLVLLSSTCAESITTPQDQPNLELSFARLGSQSILNSNAVEADNELVLGLSHAVNTADGPFFELSGDNGEVSVTEMWNSAARQVTLMTQNALEPGESYRLINIQPITSDQAKPLNVIDLDFNIRSEPLNLVNVMAGTVVLQPGRKNSEVPLETAIEIEFSRAVTLSSLQRRLTVSEKNGGSVPLEISPLTETSYEIRFTDELNDLTAYQMVIGGALGTDNGLEFTAAEISFFTEAGTDSDFPELSDDELLNLVQEQTFKYFWDFAHPVSGLSRERNTSGDIVTSGGSGFGLMAMIVAVERGFITLDEGVDRWKLIVDFLEDADRFHGAWSHWLNGASGAVVPFGADDDGGDLVETAFLVQGLLTVRQYLLQKAPQETALIAKINTLWEGVEWDWYTQGTDEGLYWHWSPNFNFEKNHKITGHNETQITYILAAASPTHSIDKTVYEKGYGRSGALVNGNTYYDIELPLGFELGGPLFFTHYSYLGLDPRNLSDQYANYWTQNVNHSRINHAYCVDNPKNFYGYDESSWGLTASDSNPGYTAHSPRNDRGVITPTAALSSLPYTPEESMAAFRHFYYQLGDRLWGEYGFYDAFHPEENWVADSYLAIDQGPIIIMIENHRSGLLWDLFMTAPEVSAGLDKLGFTY